MEGYVCRLQQKLGVTFESGRNPEVKSVRLTLDPVPMEHRPLVWYGVRSSATPHSPVALTKREMMGRSFRWWMCVAVSACGTLASNTDPRPDGSLFSRRGHRQSSPGGHPRRTSRTGCAHTRRGRSCRSCSCTASVSGCIPMWTFSGTSSRRPARTLALSSSRSW